MSDSEDEMLTFQSGIGTICARGPGINKNNLTGLSFQSNVLTSTMNLPSQANAYRGCPQSELRSIYHERETSPMSMRSDLGPRRFHNPYYPRSCHRSVIDGRSRSPVSIRSMDTTTSMSAMDIANALKYDNFNKHELQIIKDAINRLTRNKVRKRFERRRNRNLFLKGIRRKSGYDSGEQGSDSSISSGDDRRSIRTAPYIKDFQKQDFDKIDKSILIASNKQSGLNTNCIASIKKNYIPLNPVLNKGQSNMNNLVEAIKKPELSQSTCNGNMSLKDRFTRGFLLPSQRFNMSAAQASETNNNNKTPSKKNMPYDPEEHSNINHSSEEEQIFPETQCSSSESLNPSLQRKRILEEENRSVECKRTKVSKPKTNAGHCNEDYSDLHKENDDTFKKPVIPIRKSKGKNCVAQEILISKSLQPLIPSSIQDRDTIEEPELSSQKESQNLNQTAASQTSDVSMKPSFIKRKLFTQKFDLISSKGSCSDSTAPSPQTKPVANKEKNKARKLVTSQSCLNRDVPDDDNNVMDLIHKIIPAEQINSTNASTRTTKCNPAHDDKWDVTSVISMCNSNDGSDTFTDEDIFNVQNTVKKIDNKNKEMKKPAQSKTIDCSVVLRPVDVVENNEYSSIVELPSKNRIRVSNCVKSFWDTDLESDMETENIPTWKIYKPMSITNKEKSQGVMLPPPPNITNSKPDKKNKGTILTVQGLLRNKINNKIDQCNTNNKSTNPTSQILNENYTDLNSKETKQSQKKQGENVDKPNNCKENSPKNKKLDKPNNCKENSPKNKKLDKPNNFKENSPKNKKLDKPNNFKENSPKNKKLDKPNNFKENSPKNKKLDKLNNCEENNSPRTRNKKVNNIIEPKKSVQNILTTRNKKNDNIKTRKSVEKKLTSNKKQGDTLVQAENIVANSSTKSSCRNKNTKRLLNCSGCENVTENSKNQPKESAKLTPKTVKAIKSIADLPKENSKVIATKRKSKKSILNLSLDTSDSSFNISSRSLRSFNKSIK